MYMNAMVTAGITDANVKIVAPFNVSGTAALTGIYKAYEDITGKKLDNDAKLVGTQELTVTAESFCRRDRQRRLHRYRQSAQAYPRPDQGHDRRSAPRGEIKKIAYEYDVSLTDSQIDSLVSLCRSMEKLDTAALKEKVEQVQKYLKDIVSKQGEIKQFLSNVADTVTEFVNKVVDFIRGIFG